jgi:hypothetical protein
MQLRTERLTVLYSIITVACYDERCSFKENVNLNAWSQIRSRYSWRKDVSRTTEYDSEGLHLQTV